MWVGVGADYGAAECVTVRRACVSPRKQREATEAQSSAPLRESRGWAGARGAEIHRCGWASGVAGFGA